jgi:hypothetical protein
VLVVGEQRRSCRPAVLGVEVTAGTRSERKSCPFTLDQKGIRSVAKPPRRSAVSDTPSTPNTLRRLLKSASCECFVGAFRQVLARSGKVCRRRNCDPSQQRLSYSQSEGCFTRTASQLSCNGLPMRNWEPVRFSASVGASLSVALPSFEARSAGRPTRYLVWRVGPRYRNGALAQRTFPSPKRAQDYFGVSARRGCSNAVSALQHAGENLSIHGGLSRDGDPNHGSRPPLRLMQAQGRLL